MQDIISKKKTLIYEEVIYGICSHLDYYRVNNIKLFLLLCLMIYLINNIIAYLNNNNIYCLEKIVTN